MFCIKVFILVGVFSVCVDVVCVCVSGWNREHVMKANKIWDDI